MMNYRMTTTGLLTLLNPEPYGIPEVVLTLNNFFVDR